MLYCNLADKRSCAQVIKNLLKTISIIYDLMVDSNPYPRACKSLSSRVRHGALGPDGALEEWQEDVRDRVDGPDLRLG